jgi:cell division GTPase FtsZ
MIGVIGVGGAGGNIAEEAQKRGLLSGAINFSQKDLDAVDVLYKLRLTGSEGVGKNRNEAITLFQNQWESVIKFIRNNFANLDIIFIAFSTSGGSGSGISPLLIEILTNIYPDKVISALTVCPDLSEATVSQVNCLSTFEELSKLPISIFPIDNQQLKSEHAAKNKVFEISNSRAIDLISNIASYTEKASKNGNFDTRDFLTVFGTKGIGLIAETEISTLTKGMQLSPDWVASKIIDSWQTGIFIPPQNERVTRAAVIFDGQEGLMEFLDYPKCFTNYALGTPIDLFEGYYHESKGKIITILTGLGWCNKRLQDIELSMERNKDNVESMLIEQNNYQSKTVSVLDRLRKPINSNKQSVTDILSKYNKK